MKGKKQDIDTILKRGETEVRCILLYGPNTFVIRELYKQLCESLFDENDVFTLKMKATLSESQYVTYESVSYTHLTLPTKRIV